MLFGQIVTSPTQLTSWHHHSHSVFYAGQSSNIHTGVSLMVQGQSYMKDEGVILSCIPWVQQVLWATVVVHYQDDTYCLYGHILWIAHHRFCVCVCVWQCTILYSHVHHASENPQEDTIHCPRTLSPLTYLQMLLCRPFFFFGASLYSSFCFGVKVVQPCFITCDRSVQ